MATSKPVQSNEVIVDGVFEPTIRQADATLKKLGKMVAGFKAVLKASNEVFKNNKDPKTAKQINLVVSALDKSTKSRKGLVEVQTEQEKLSKRLSVLRSKEAKEIAKTREQIRKETQELKNNVKRRTEAIGSLNRQRATLIAARKRWDALSKSERENTRVGGRLSKVINRLDINVKRLEKSTGRAQRNVGNYGRAWGRVSGVMGSVGNVISNTGLRIVGITTIIFGFTRAIGDAFRRIREFDKEMQLMAGVAGLTRNGLSQVEAEIRRVASTSVKTSNEVAKLATTLFTLGKSRSEVIKLIGPVNDLSVALVSTSQEAGELLIKTLNAFGKSGDSAQEYADIIANIRASTALDFEKIKDSLGFIAPVAKAAGVSFQKTGALLGVLIDNSIKASRAGRLLGSTFIRLAKNGRSLTDAIDELKRAQGGAASELELLALSGRIFGTESAAIGLILASNTEKVAELTKEFENSRGTLDKLINEQLKSLDSQIKITTSSYEDFILSIENGEGVISSALKSALSRFSDILNILKRINEFGLLSKGAIEAYKNLVGSKTVRQLQEVDRLRKEGIKDDTILIFLKNKLATEQRNLNIQTEKGLEGSSAAALSLKAQIEATRNSIFSLEDDIERLKNKNVAAGKEDADEKLKKELSDSRLRDLTTRNIEDQQKREIKLVEDRFDDEVAKKTTTDEIIVELDKKKVADLIAINQKFADLRISDIARLQAENRKAIDQEIADAKKKADDLEKIEVRKRKDAIDNALAITSALDVELDKRSDLRSSEREREISANRDDIEIQAQLARDGKANQLAFERAEADKLALQKIEAQEKEARTREGIQLVEAYYNSLNARLDGGADPNSAPLLALKDTLFAKGIAKGLLPFFEGTEDTGSKGVLSDENGVITGYTHSNERVMTAEQNAIIGGMSNIDLTALAYNHNNGLSSNGGSFENLRESIMLNNEVKGLLSEIKDAIKSQPRQQVDVDGLGNLIETVYRNGRKEVTRHIHNRKRLG